MIVCVCHVIHGSDHNDTKTQQHIKRQDLRDNLASDEKFKDLVRTLRDPSVNLHRSRLSFVFGLLLYFGSVRRALPANGAPVHIGTLTTTHLHLDNKGAKLAPIRVDLTRHSYYQSS